MAEGSQRKGNIAGAAWAYSKAAEQAATIIKSYKLAHDCYDEAAGLYERLAKESKTRESIVRHTMNSAYCRVYAAKNAMKEWHDSEHFGENQAGTAEWLVFGMSQALKCRQHILTLRDELGVDVSRVRRYFQDQVEQFDQKRRGLIELPPPKSTPPKRALT